MEKVYEVIQKLWNVDSEGKREGSPEITTFICADKEAAKVLIGNILLKLCAETAEDGEKQNYSVDVCADGLTCNASDTEVGREYEISASEMPVITGEANGKPKANGRKWYEVTATETYKRTFRVLAGDAVDAREIIKDAMNDGRAKCTEGKGFSCERGEVMESRQVDTDEYVNTFVSEGYYE